MGKGAETLKKMISTSKWHAKHPFAGQNTQHPEGEIFFSILIAPVMVTCPISTSLKQKKSPILRPLIFAPGASAPGAPPSVRPC